MIEIADPWLWPPETDGHGAASFAEMTRMVFGPVPAAWHIRKVPGDDPWYCR